MNRTGFRHFYRRILGISLVLSASPLFAWDLFTHAGINLPFEFRADGPWYLDIDSEEEWETFWQAMLPQIIADEELLSAPHIDFRRYRVLAMGLGEVSHGGYSIQVDVALSGLDRFVTAHVLIPGAGCLTTANVNYPTVAILLPKSGQSPTFSHDTFTRDCD